MRNAHAFALAGSLAALALAAGCAHRSAPREEEAVEVHGRIVSDPPPHHDPSREPCADAAAHEGGDHGCRCHERPAE